MSETRWREVSFKAAVEVPTVPNFLRVKGEDQTIPLSAIDPDDLRALGEDWTEALVRRAREQREAPVAAPSTPDTGAEG